MSCHSVKRAKVRGHTHTHLRCPQVKPAASTHTLIINAKPSNKALSSCSLVAGGAAAVF